MSKGEAKKYWLRIKLIKDDLVTLMHVHPRTYVWLLMHTFNFKMKIPGELSRGLNIQAKNLKRSIGSGLRKEIKQ